MLRLSHVLLVHSYTDGMKMVLGCGTFPGKRDIVTAKYVRFCQSEKALQLLHHI